jgi:hypothetical protein
MEDRFLTYWFRGLEEGLGHMSEKERTILLSACGKACSCSYSLGVYQDAYAKTGDIKGFLKNLKSAFPELSYRISEDQMTVTILYDHCACDLYNKGLVKTGLLYECSRQSLLYNWEAVMGEGSVEVEMKGSILQGDERCVFEVKIL